MTSVKRGQSFNLKYGVFVLMLWCVPCSVFPWDPEAHGLTVDPHQTRVSPAVHLSDQPGLQANTSRGDWHPDCQENTSQSVHSEFKSESLPREPGIFTPLNDK